jgi:hypothetical protein
MRAAVLALCAVAFAPSGCSSVTRCSAHADCPVQSFCQLDETGLAGVCRQECTATVDCPAGLRCTALGQCALLDLRDDGGADAAAPDAAAPDATAVDAAAADAADGDGAGGDVAGDQDGGAEAGPS